MRTKFVLFVTLAASLSLGSCGEKSKEIHPERKDITETVFASGSLDCVNKYNLTAQSEGYLVELLVKDGDSISMSQVVARIENVGNEAQAANSAKQLEIANLNLHASAPALAELQANIDFAQHKLDQDQLQLKRYETLYGTQSVSKLELENAQLAVYNSQANVAALNKRYQLLKQQAEVAQLNQRAIAETQQKAASFNQLVSLSNGRIMKLMKKKGDYVRKGDVVAVVANTGDLVAKVNIDENSIERIHVGQRVHVRLNVQKDRLFEGVVETIYPLFDEASQSFLCDIRFDNGLDFQIMGTRLEANIDVNIKQQALLIPRAYLSFSSTVQVKGEDTPRAVKVGILSTDYAEILEGITENDVLIPLKK